MPLRGSDVDQLSTTKPCSDFHTREKNSQKISGRQLLIIDNYLVSLIEKGNSRLLSTTKQITFSFRRQQDSQTTFFSGRLRIVVDNKMPRLWRLLAFTFSPIFSLINMTKNRQKEALWGFRWRSCQCKRLSPLRLRVRVSHSPLMHVKS